MSAIDVKSMGRELRQIQDPVTRRLLGSVLENIDILKSAVLALENPDNLTWRNLVLQNSWVQYSDAKQLPQFAKTSEGLVLVRGSIKDGTTTGGTVLSTVPKGFRSERIISFITESNGNDGEIDVYPNGDLVIQNGHASELSLGGIIYAAYR